MRTIFSLFFLTLLSAKVFAQTQIDYTFGEDGIVQTYLPFTTGCSGSILAIQPDEKILLGGYADVAGPLNHGWGIARYNSDGSLDASFGGYGTITVGFADEGMYTMSLLQNGKIAVEEWRGLENYLRIVNSEGLCDNGNLIPNEFILGYGMASTNDDNVILAGAIKNGIYYGFGLTRFKNTGGLDSSFGSNGIVLSKIDSNSWATCVSVLSDGRILAGGMSGTNTSSWDFTLTRYFSDGKTDSSFGTNGIVVTDIDSSDDHPFFLKVLSDSNIQLSGLFFTDSHYGVAVLRYKMNGEIDSVFFDNGKLIIPFDTVYFPIYSMAIQSDWKIIVGGTLGTSQNADFAIARYKTDGTLDSSFGGDGLITVDLSSNADFGNAVAIQSDGKILEAGEALDEFGLVRFLPELNIGIADLAIKPSSLFVYPNPIHESEILKYALTKDETLTLCLYDINGILVKTFFANETRRTGQHDEELHFGNLVAANYLLTLSNGKQQLSVKLVKL